MGPERLDYFIDEQNHTKVSKILHSNIQKLRKERGLTLDDVQFYTRISRGVLSNIKGNRGYNPTLYTLVKLSTFFQITICDLLTPDEKIYTEATTALGGKHQDIKRRKGANS